MRMKNVMIILFDFINEIKIVCKLSIYSLQSTRIKKSMFRVSVSVEILSTIFYKIFIGVFNGIYFLMNFARLWPTTTSY